MSTAEALDTFNTLKVVPDQSRQNTDDKGRQRLGYEPAALQRGKDAHSDCWGPPPPKGVVHDQHPRPSNVLDSLGASLPWRWEFPRGHDAD